MHNMPRLLACRKRIEYWHEIGLILEIERAMGMKEAS
jgi:hypothetical protein